MSTQWRREGRAAAPAGGDAPPPAKRLIAPLGQGEPLARWTALARALVLPHGFVVEGPRGVGKSTVIDWLTAALCCPSDLDPDAPCGVCRTCTRVANGVHPDVHLVDRAHDDADRAEWKKSFYVIKVDQVRRAQELLQHHSLEGRARVLVIADADCLEEEGQNALLKTLEEPGAATFLLLEATRPERLLPTVHSRVQRLRVRPLDDTALRGALHRLVPEHSVRHDAAVAVAGGSLGQALLACTERVVQLHDLVAKALAAPDRLRPVATARAVLAGCGGERRVEIDVARTFLWLLRAELVRARDALATEEATPYGAAPAEPWTTWLERTLAAERDLDLLIPPEQALTCCLVSFAAG
jgi:DNA polymerase-3 subunit delta'